MENGLGLEHERLERYTAQMALAGFGREGQKKISGTSVLVIGAGGLGCPALQYLATAGIGRLGIVDFDTVSESNLSRQVLYGVSDVGSPKVDVAALALRHLNPAIEISAWKSRFSLEMLSVVSEFDVVLDCSDRFTTRFDLCVACAETDRVLVTAAAERMGGLLGVFRPAVGSCYACAAAEVSESENAPCAERGILGPVTGILGAWAAAEALRWAVLGESPILGKILHVDLERNRTATFTVDRHSRCPFHSIGNRNAEEPRWLTRAELPANARVYDLSSDESSDVGVAWPYEKWLAGDFPVEVAEGNSALYCTRSQRSYIVANLLQRKGIRTYVVRN